ncbi:MAG: Na/Pi cotransporter family protein [Bacilli bacterium]|nr:Na/Pi cotransporter family protein [Bacilli bacterium]
MVSEIIESIITLLVGAATFLVGMNLMSGGLKKSTGKSVKRLFKKTENNRFIGMGIGAAATALVQSSAATSVMTIGFISAGIMSVFQGVSVILGAYLGTTATGLLVSLSSLNISTYLLLVTVVGVVLMFFKKESLRNFGEILAGLGVLFVGLESMKGAFPAGGELTQGVQKLFETVKNPFLLLIIGMLFTALVQSSSATSGIVIVMVGQKAIGLDSGFYLVLGATVGTIITTVLAGIGGNTNVKRTILIAFADRAVCALIGTIITLIFQDQFVTFFSTAFGNYQFGLAMFLVIYNVIFLLIISPFLKPIVKLFERIVKDKEAEGKKNALHFIDDRLINTPTIALEMVRKEIANMLKEAFVNYKLAYKQVIEQDFETSEEIEEREDTIDYINNKVTEYLINLSNKVSLQDESSIGSYFHMINDIERIGDHAINFHEKAEKMSADDLKFSEIAVSEFNQMTTVIEQMFEIVINDLETNKTLDLPHLHDLEEETDKLKLKLSNQHYDRLSSQTCTIELSPFYSTLVSELERVADHLVNVGYALVNPTGDDELEK